MLRLILSLAIIAISLFVADRSMVSGALRDKNSRKTSVAEEVSYSASIFLGEVVDIRTRLSNENFFLPERVTFEVSMVRRKYG